MTLLKWIGIIVIIFWILGVLLRIGGVLINWLLIMAAIVFIVDLIIVIRRRN